MNATTATALTTAADDHGTLRHPLRGLQRQTAQATAVISEHASSLRRHLGQCQAAQKPWAVLRMHAEDLHALIAPRFVSTLVLGTLFIIAACTVA